MSVELGEQPLSTRVRILLAAAKAALATYANGNSKPEAALAMVAEIEDVLERDLEAKLDADMHAANRRRELAKAQQP